jgi:hypothetical protein
MDNCLVLKGGSRYASFAQSDHRIRIVDAYHDRICGRVMIRVSSYAISIRRYDTVRPMSCRFLSDHIGTMMVHRLDHDYCEDTDTEQIGGVHNLIRGLIQYNTDTVIGYGDRIGQMIMSGPALKASLLLGGAV